MNSSFKNGQAEYAGGGVYVEEGNDISIVNS